MLPHHGVTQAAGTLSPSTPHAAHDTNRERLQVIGQNLFKNLDLLCEMYPLFYPKFTSPVPVTLNLQHMKTFTPNFHAGETAALAAIKPVSIVRETSQQTAGHDLDSYFIITS